MQELIDFLQLGVNGAVLVVLGWLYLAYIKSLKSRLFLKDEQLKTTEKNLSYWKDVANQLEKRSPEFVEDALEKRIKIREAELARLSKDAQNNSIEIEQKNRQLAILQTELEKAKYFSTALTYYDNEIDDDVIIPESDIELVSLGEVGVDSGSLMITDPCYIDLCWKKEGFVPQNKFKDVSNGRVYQIYREFMRYDETLEGYDKTINELIKDGVWEPIEEHRPMSYSHSGAAHATLTNEGYGALPFDDGKLGAGFAIKTVHGDGFYQIIGERYKGDIVRIYIDLR
ncbi:hypothetical protein L1D34_10310 [Vibrio mediterranei]|uniref:hypothetical protein n=1 Tax=Vibrio mediterranei TaxID=689 RepID=UPI001EFE8B33|nr:hypothetical protein [Vibrio mediterranei]MCG9625234.1 hypothetical protein [Vibrio mediterranei]